MFILYDASDTPYELPLELVPAWVAPEMDLGMERAPGASTGFAVGDGKPKPAAFELAGEIAAADPGALATLLDAIEAALGTATALAFEEGGTEVWRRPVDTGARARWSLQETPVGRFSNVSQVRVGLMLARLDSETAGSADQADTSPAITVG